MWVFEETLGLKSHCKYNVVSPVQAADVSVVGNSFSSQDQFWTLSWSSFKKKKKKPHGWNQLLLSDITTSQETTSSSSTTTTTAPAAGTRVSARPITAQIRHPRGALTYAWACVLREARSHGDSYSSRNIYPLRGRLNSGLTHFRSRRKLINRIVMS